MKVIGLTGGIASGKTTVASMLQTARIPIIDADILARQVVAPGTVGLQQITRYFGAEILLEDGSLNRSRLGALVFSDSQKRKALEAITHPLVAEALLQAIRVLEEKGLPFAVYVAPLMFETGTYKRFLATVMVDIPEALQLERLVTRGSLSKEQAEQRITAQMPRQQKLALADAVLDNSGNLEHTAYQLRQIWFRLTGQDIAFQPSPMAI